MAADRTWLSGSMGMLILRLLSEKDMYGYEMESGHAVSAASRTGGEALSDVL